MPGNLKNILLDLVPQDEDPTRPTAATKFAAVLAQSANAFLTVNFLSPRSAWIPYSPFTSMPADAIGTQNTQLDEMAKISLHTAGKAAEAVGVPSRSELIALDFLALMGRCTRKARLQDVVVMDATSNVLCDYREIIEGMLFRSGRPVVLVPARWAAGFPSKITIAWDGSIPAARAVSEALPLLQKAEEVCVVTIQREVNLTNTAPGGELAVYLDRHGIRVRQECLAIGSHDVADTLRDSVARSGAEMIIMGAYAHSRLREVILGGVTRSLLDLMPVPLFLVH